MSVLSFRVFTRFRNANPQEQQNSFGNANFAIFVFLSEFARLIRQNDNNKKGRPHQLKERTFFLFLNFNDFFFTISKFHVF